jgi:1-deoxy-D-xylulose-5-phosphate reductoisomerase
MVEFVDGSIIAQCSPPDMKLPISLGMTWPDRIADVSLAVDFTMSHSWDFEPLDEQVFKAVWLARQVGASADTYPAVYNAANEEAVEAFHQGRISFTKIVELIEETLARHTPAAQLTLDGVLEAERWARETANSLINKG